MKQSFIEELIELLRQKGEPYSSITPSPEGETLIVADVNLENLQDRQAQFGDAIRSLADEIYAKTPEGVVIHDISMSAGMCQETFETRGKVRLRYSPC